MRCGSGVGVERSNVNCMISCAFILSHRFSRTRSTRIFENRSRSSLFDRSVPRTYCFLTQRVISNCGVSGYTTNKVMIATAFLPSSPKLAPVRSSELCTRRSKYFWGILHRRLCTRCVVVQISPINWALKSELFCSLPWHVSQLTYCHKNYMIIWWSRKPYMFACVVIYIYIYMYVYRKKYIYI